MLLHFILLSQQRLRRLCLLALFYFAFLPIAMNHSMDSSDITIEFLTFLVEELCTRSDYQSPGETIASDFNSFGPEDLMNKWRLESHQTKFLLLVLCPHEYHHQFTSSIRTSTASIVTSQRLPERRLERDEVTKHTNPFKKPTKDELEAVKKVQEVLDDGYGNGFVLRCLREYGNVEQVR